MYKGSQSVVIFVVIFREKMTTRRTAWIKALRAFFRFVVIFRGFKHKPVARQRGLRAPYH
jgi:hypothetical protein